MEPKLCQDKECLSKTYICISCKRVCCRHFCSNRDEKGSAVCSICTIKRQERQRENDIKIMDINNISNDNNIVLSEEGI